MGNVNGTRLVVTVTTMTDGIPIIEGVERTDKDFVVGVQFHPEVAVAKVIDNELDAGDLGGWGSRVSIVFLLPQPTYHLTANNLM